MNAKIQQWRAVLNYLADFEMGSLEHTFYTQVVNELKLQYTNDQQILPALGLPAKKNFWSNFVLFFSSCMSFEEDINIVAVTRQEEPVLTERRLAPL